MMPTIFGRPAACLALMLGPATSHEPPTEQKIVASLL